MLKKKKKTLGRRATSSPCPTGPSPSWPNTPGSPASPRSPFHLPGCSRTGFPRTRPALTFRPWHLPFSLAEMPSALHLAASFSSSRFGLKCHLLKEASVVTLDKHSLPSSRPLLTSLSFIALCFLPSNSDNLKFNFYFLSLLF